MTVYNAGQPVDIGGSTVSWNELETMAPSKGKLWSDVVWYDDARHIVAYKARDSEGALIDDGEGGDLIQEWMSILRETPEE